MEYASNGKANAALTTGIIGTAGVGLGLLGNLLGGLVLAVMLRYSTIVGGAPLALMQSRKIEALGVADLVDEVLLCWEHEAPKPDPACYLEALRRMGAFPAQAVVIGDNPGHDMAAAAAVGCRSVRVRTGKFAALGDHGFPADAEAPSFVQIAPVLARLEPGDGA